MSVYRHKGSKRWTMDFVIRGQRVRETTDTRDKATALRIERKRRQQLEEGAWNIGDNSRPPLMLVAAEAWLAAKTNKLEKSTLTGYRSDLKHLLPAFGKSMICDIRPQHISDYQKLRLSEDASPKTINNEVGTLRAILTMHGNWSPLQQKRKAGAWSMLPTNDDVGRAITAAEERALLDACGKSRSRSLLPFFVLAIETGARFNVVRTLQWKNVDFANRSLKFGKDKSPSGTGRIIPLNSRATSALQFWATTFPDRKPEHYVFATERYGLDGQDGHLKGQAVPYSVNPEKPMGSWKTAWNAARKEAKVSCRWHDARHTAVSRMLDAGVPLAKIAKIVGWSPATMVRMSARYGHFSLDELRGAVESISRNTTEPVAAKFSRVAEGNGGSRFAN